MCPLCITSLALSSSTAAGAAALAFAASVARLTRRTKGSRQ